MGRIGAVASNTQLPVGSGGTGADNAGLARSNLGVKGMGEQESYAVVITGGSIVGISDMLVGDGGTGRSNPGNRQVYIPSSAMWPATTSGCSAITKVELPTIKANHNFLDFHPTLDQYAEFAMKSPDYWDGGQLTFTPVWTMASGTGELVWNIEGHSFGDGESLDVALGSGVGVVDAAGSAYAEMVAPTSTGLTMGGTPAAMEYLHFRLWRSATAAADQLNVHARLHGVILEFGVNSYST